MYFVLTSGLIDDVNLPFAKNTWDPYNINNIYIRIILHTYPDGKPILSDKYYLYNLRTIKKLRLKINEKFVACICAINNIELLEWWKNSGLPLKYDTSALIFASTCGHIQVLEWWLKSNLPLKLNTSTAITYASRNGHVDVLEWWKNSGLPLQYCEQSLSFIETYHINILEWWKNSGLKMYLFYDCMDFASTYGHIEVLEWWLKSNLPLDMCYSEESLKNASKYGHINVLTWWVNSKLPLKYSVESLELEMYDMPILEWWENSGLLDN